MKKIQRTFIPGDKWVYFKMYIGNKTADIILIDDISNIIKRFKKKQLISKWFFIRYNDPDFHIRIRFLANNEFAVGYIINLFYLSCNRLIKRKEIWKLQLDTYNREIERYHGELIENTESIFWLDSECILSILKLLEESKNENYRWMIALKLIDELLSDFDFDIFKKQELSKVMSDSLKKEFEFDKYNSKQFNLKFRENKKIVESILNGHIEDEIFRKLYLAIRIRAKGLIPIISNIKKSSVLKREDWSLEILISSYVHMTINRLFRSKNRLHELIIYDFLYRYYTSEIAKNKIITE